MATFQSNDLAGNGTRGSVEPFQLFAGEKEIVTAHDPVAASTEIAKYEVIARNTSGELVPYDADGEDGEDKAIGIAAQPIKTDAVTVQSLPYYVSGFFNHEALVWPAGVTTLAQRKALFVGTEIQIGSLYGAA